MDACLRTCCISERTSNELRRGASSDAVTEARSRSGLETGGLHIGSSVHLAGEECGWPCALHLSAPGAGGKVPAEQTGLPSRSDSDVRPPVNDGVIGCHLGFRFE